MRENTAVLHPFQWRRNMRAAGASEPVAPAAVTQIIAARHRLMIATRQVAAARDAAYDDDRASAGLVDAYDDLAFAARDFTRVVDALPSDAQPAGWIDR